MCSEPLVMKGPDIDKRANLLGAEAKQHGACPQRHRRPLQQRRDLRLLLLPKQAALGRDPPAPPPPPPLTTRRLQGGAGHGRR